MILMRGTGASGGVAEGPLFFLRRQEAAVERRAADPAAELERFARVQRQTAGQLEALAEGCRIRREDEAAALLSAHAMIALDEDLAACVRDMVAQEGCSAAYAVREAGERFAARFSAMDDPYMQARAADVRDVSRRLVEALSGAQGHEAGLPGPVILAADDVLPSDAVQLDRSRVLAIVTREGSANGHTAILARTMGIPAMCGLGAALAEEYEGRMAAVDGETGLLALEPEGAVLGEIRRRQAALQARAAEHQALRGLPDVTRDGRRIEVGCNIGAPEDLQAVRANDGRSIGLFRSEFLYLASADYPTEEAQYQAYRTAAAAMEGARVIIRTLDIGADKQAGYFALRREENPALGLRGIRLCLERPELLHTQLRAIYRASAHGRVAILFPMIASLWEVQACRQACRRAKAELAREGVPFDPATELGVMIETPAAVLTADALAREVDFFSVGTNDLTQYILACDRQAGGLERYCDPRHPAVLRAVRLAVEAAHRAGIWAGVCGDLAADVTMLPAFLAMGVDELSVPPAAVLPLRAAIRRSAAGKGRCSRRSEPEE